jgi:hypothetical protein
MIQSFGQQEVESNVFKYNSGQYISVNDANIKGGPQFGENEYQLKTP